VDLVSTPSTPCILITKLPLLSGGKELSIKFFFITFAPEDFCLSKLPALLDNQYGESGGNKYSKKK
jgi:hypothetical protein